MGLRHLHAMARYRCLEELKRRRRDSARFIGTQPPAWSNTHAKKEHELKASLFLLQELSK